jgi:2-hydroxychromene-2-carboxylate isomerase
MRQNPDNRNIGRDDSLPIKFYYDFKSPFTFLAFDPAVDLERTHRVRLRFIPHLFDFQAYGGALEVRNERDWRKVRYLYRDVRRFASERGIIIRGPQKLFDSRLALMSGLYADRHGKFREYARPVWELFFRRELDLEQFDQLAPLIRNVDLDPEEFRRYSQSDGPRDLAEALAEGERDKIFGVPTLLVDGEPFWGNDRVDWVIKKLDAMGLRRIQ